MLNKAARFVRSLLYKLAANESLFLVGAFLLCSVGRMGPLSWNTRELSLLNQYVMIPWGAALVLLRLVRAKERKQPLRADVLMVLLLFAWVTLPFFWRFGFTELQVRVGFQWMIVFIALYASVSEREPKERECLMDWAPALFALVSLVLGGLLLYMAFTRQAFRLEWKHYAFGLTVQMDRTVRPMIYQVYLSAGLDYNTTGMIAGCCLFMSLLGFFRRKSVPGKLFHLIPSLMMVLVLILTQSRTARYAMLGAMAVGAYGALAFGKWGENTVKRQLAGLLAGVTVLLVGNMACSGITNLALRYYDAGEIYEYGPYKYDEEETEEGELTEEAAGTEEELPAEAEVTADADASLMKILLASADMLDQIEMSAEEEAAAAEAAALESGAIANTGRGSGGIAINARAATWNNLFNYWKENPKHFLIGDRIGGEALASLQSPTAHNALLEWMMDYGLVGGLLLLGFTLTLIGPALRVFFAGPDAAHPGDRVLCMIVVYNMMTGMMESQPLMPMMPINMVFFFTLALLANRGREMGPLRRRKE